MTKPITSTPQKIPFLKSKVKNKKIFTFYVLLKICQYYILLQNSKNNHYILIIL